MSLITKIKSLVKKALKVGVKESEVDDLMKQEKASAQIASSHAMTKIAEKIGKTLKNSEKLGKNALKKEFWENKIKSPVQNAAITSQLVARAKGAWSPGEDRDPEFRVFMTQNDDKVRESHKRYHGLVLPKDSKTWKALTPPLDYNCRCYLVPADADGVKKLGFDVGEEPHIRMVKTRKDGKVIEHPEGVSPSWAGNTAELANRGLLEVYVGSLKALPKDLKSVSQDARDALTIAFNKRLAGDADSLDVLRDDTVDALPVSFINDTLVTVKPSEKIKMRDFQKKVAKIKSIPAEFTYKFQKYKINKNGEVTLK